MRVAEATVQSQQRAALRLKVVAATVDAVQRSLQVQLRRAIACARNRALDVLAERHELAAELRFPVLGQRRRLREPEAATATTARRCRRGRRIEFPIDQREVVVL